MAVLRASLSLQQGDTFRESFLCEIPAQVTVGLGDTLETLCSAQSFELTYRDAAGYVRTHHAYVAFDGNSAILTITKEGTSLLGSMLGGGSFSVAATIGLDRWPLMRGSWQSSRTTVQIDALDTAYENFDGLIADVAAKRDATLTPENKRLFVAQGRARAAVRISDAKRMDAEDVIFQATATTAQERPFALCIDETNDLLYTLTDAGAIYCESIADQTAPVQARAPLLLAGFLVAGEVVADLAVWSAPGEEVLVLLTSRRVVTIRTIAGVLTIVGSTSEVKVSAPITDANPNPALSINSLLVIDHSELRVAKDGDGRVVAYVQCSARAYEIPPSSRPFAQILVLCDLDLAGSYATPHFTTAGAPYCVFYNPYPVLPAAWAAFVAAAGSDPDGFPFVTKTDYTVFDTQTFDAGAAKWLFVAHGRRNQVRKIEVTHAFTAGIVVGPSLACHPNFPGDPYNAQDISHVHVDPTNINHLLILEEDQDGARVINGNPPTTITLLEDTRFGNGSPRKNAVIALAGRHFTVWCFDISAVDFTFRVVDASTNTPAALFEKWWFMNSDGMVAIPPAIYQLSFGGVVPYRRTGKHGEWYADADGYQPARVDSPTSPGTWLSSNTETIDVALDVNGAGDHRLFIVAASVGFMEFKVDPTTMRPGPARAFLLPPIADHPLFPGWPAGGPEDGTFYSNDVVPVKIDGEWFVLVDITNRELSQYALAAWRFDRVHDTWSLVDAVVVQTSFPAFEIPLSSHIHVTRDLRNNRFAIVDTDGAIFVVLLADLARRGKLSLCDYHARPAGSGVAFQSPGSASSLGRLLLSVWPIGSDAAHGRVIVYNFDLGTGVVDYDHPVQVFESSSVALPAGSAWDKLFKTRFRQLRSDGYGALYLCGAAGTLIELEYDPARALPLRFKSSWQSDYHNALCDAHGYDFGDGYQLLLSKNIEGFALIVPSVK